MAQAYAWHSGTGCVSPRWAIPVPLLPDELLSSWLVRAALAHGCDPLVLTGQIWPKWRVWAIDTDRHVGDGRLDTLSAVSGVPMEAFKKALLDSVARRIHGRIPLEKAIWPWILAIGARNTKRRGGLQYCPRCLAEDAHPHYRIQWRLAWHTACERHGFSLLDRCQVCRAPVEPHRLHAEDRLASVCASCRADLRDANGHACPADAMNLQRLADSVACQGNGEALGQPIDATEWFGLADFLLAFLRRANRSRTAPLKGLLDLLDAPLPDAVPLMPGAGIELLRTQERQVLLGWLWRAITADGKRFQTALAESAMTQQNFCGQEKHLPGVLVPLTYSLPNRPVVRSRKLRRPCSGPRQRHEVMRMLARLQRKLEMERR